MNISQLCKSIKKISQKVHVTCVRKIKCDFESLRKSGSVYVKKLIVDCKFPPPTVVITYTQRRPWDPLKVKRTFNFLGLGVLKTPNCKKSVSTESSSTFSSKCLQCGMTGVHKTEI